MKRIHILFLCLTGLFCCFIAGRYVTKSQRVRGVFNDLLSQSKAAQGYVPESAIHWLDFPITAQLNEGGVPGGLHDVTHPAVLYFPNPLPQIKHNLWIALTPYPESIDGECYENTCVYHGHYDEQKGEINDIQNIRQNPILFRDYAGFNSDPELFYDENDSLMYCITRKQNCPDAQNVFVLQHSRDGETWSDPVPIFKTDGKMSLCPCLLKVNDTYSIYVFNPDEYYAVQGNYDIWTSPSLSNPDFKLMATHKWPHPNIGIWHGDVIYHKGYYYMVFCGFNKEYTNPILGGMIHSRFLWLARSTDGTNWQFYDKPLLQKSGLYRSSLFIDTNENMVVTFSVNHREFSELYPSGNRIGYFSIPMQTVDSLMDSVDSLTDSVDSLTDSVDSLIDSPK